MVKFLGSVMLGLGLFLGLAQESKACPQVVQQQVVSTPSFVSSQAIIGFDVFGNPIVSTNFTPVTVVTGNSITTVFAPNNGVFLPGSIVVGGRSLIIFRNGRFIVR